MDNNIKALILDFDYTLFDTSSDNEVRKNSKTKDWDIIYSKIPEYKLYDGWREVFETLKNKNIKIAIISTAKRELIEKTLEFFNMQCDVIIGWQLYYQKPHPHLVQMALDRLHISNEDVISIGDSLVDKIMSQNGEVRFIGATWDSSEATVLTSGETISKPMEILRLLDV